MRQKFLASASTLAVLLVFAPGATASRADVAAIRQARSAMNQAFDAHDMMALASFMTNSRSVQLAIQVHLITE
jgi:hypothetical protein